MSVSDLGNALEGLETDLANVKDLNAMVNGLRADDSVLALIVANLAPQAVDAVRRQASNVVKSSLSLANDGYVVPPSLSYDLGESGSISLSDSDKLSSIDSVAPDRTPCGYIL